jgi:4-hydroxybenzoyl-CoA thioesterase
VLKVADDQQGTWAEYVGPYPMCYRRRIAWGDCDPAGIIYTPRVLDVAMETLERWYIDVLDADWPKLNSKMAMGAPTVRAEIDFVAAPKPDEYILSELLVQTIGNSSVTYMITGTDGEGFVYYRCKLVSCFIARPQFEAAAIPDVLRKRIEIYRLGCEGIAT